MNKFKTFVTTDPECLENDIVKWLSSIKGTEVQRSAPSIAFSPLDPSGGGGIFYVAVTVTAEISDN